MSHYYKNINHIHLKFKSKETFNASYTFVQRKAQQLLILDKVEVQIEN